MSYRFSRQEIEQLNARFRGETPQEVLRWAAETFGRRVTLQSSMQKTAGVLMHMVSQIAPQMEVVFVDTGVHFPETLDLRNEFQRRYGLNIRTYSPAQSFDEQYEQYGRHLYLYDSDPGYARCCELRKEIPFLQAVKGRFDAVIGGLMRDEGGARRHIEVLGEDPRIEGYKLYPLAYWNEEQVDAYSREYDLPVHALYAKGYKSIGCWTCTTPVGPGEDKRAGRWRHIREANPNLAGSTIYCGINYTDRQANSDPEGCCL